MGKKKCTKKENLHLIEDTERSNFSSFNSDLANEQVFSGISKFNQDECSSNINKCTVENEGVSSNLVYQYKEAKKSTANCKTKSIQNIKNLTTLDKNITSNGIIDAESRNQSEIRHSQNMLPHASNELAVFNAKCSGARPKHHSVDLDQRSSTGITSENSMQYQDIFRSVLNYDKFKKSFYNVFKIWKVERESSINKLKELKRLVHKDQLFYNKAKCICKEVNVQSRLAKVGEVSSSVDFLASFTAFITDAADSISSVAQAVNIDSYQNTFKEIMERDSKFSEKFYASRSMCMKQYEDVEEVIRQYHFTFDDMLSNISKALNVDKLMLTMGENQQGGTLGNFTRIASECCTQEAMEVVRESIKDFTTYNPAAVEACTSAGRAIYDVLDWMLKDSKNRNTLKESISSCGNLIVLTENKNELVKLKHVVREDEPQAKLEMQIDDAIDAFQYELDEVCSSIFELERCFKELGDSY